MPNEMTELLDFAAFTATLRAASIALGRADDTVAGVTQDAAEICRLAYRSYDDDNDFQRLYDETRLAELTRHYGYELCGECGTLTNVEGVLAIPKLEMFQEGESLRWKQSDVSSNDLIAETEGLTLIARKNDGGRFGFTLELWERFGECPPGKEKQSAIQEARTVIAKLVKWLRGTVTWK